VYDIDNATSTLDDDDFLGQMECTLGEVWKGEGSSLLHMKRRGDLMKNIHHLEIRMHKTCV